MGGALAELQSAKVEQAQQLETYLGSVTVQLEAGNRQLLALEKKLDVEHRLQQNMFEDTQAQLRKQDERLRQVMVAAVIVLAAMAGAIFFWSAH